MLPSALRRIAATRVATVSARLSSTEAAKQQGRRELRQRDWSHEVERSRMESGEWVRDSYGRSETPDEHRQLEVTILKVAFEEFDLDKNGVLDRDEIKAALETLDLPSSDEILDKIFGDYDDNHDGVISLDEWLNRESQDLRTRIYEAFKDKCEASG
ncbi:hypothetical protein DIPPA_00818 [Diplonema papillatum]|nr:hypothetical protein DIPPA_00818 [Diplonema papillatum]